MIKFNIITIFPEIFSSYLEESLISRAQKKKLIKINVYNLRKWAKDNHKTVDDRPFGGGLGMVLKVEPIFKAVNTIKVKNRAYPNSHDRGNLDKLKESKKKKVILFTPRGKKFNQKIAFQLSKLDQLIFICGRYEGVDERVAKNIADVELSIGDYDLMGGELPAMVVIETISRLVPGVLGKPQLLRERITKSGGFLEYAQYTRPEVFCPTPGVGKKTPGVKTKCWRVPKVLLSGDHKKIDNWKKNHCKVIEK
ncbi:MAG: hypothetical protein CEN87_340 [Parcubacteria group bacterium Licking1014_1]|nr:MAG: hypothetical protein CEN87_340 [Parcubacteria group bacterium Licking1014_1]